MAMLAFALNCNAQSIARQSISSYGSSHTAIGQSIFSQTVGQPYSTTLQSGNHVSQGFQQSKIFKLEIVNPDIGEELNIKVYPNPAKHSVIIQSTEVLKGGYVKVTNVEGRTIYEQQIHGSLIHRINCIAWNPGIYIIKVRDNSDNLSINKLVIAN